MYIGKNWYFRWSNCIISLLLVLGYLNLKQNILLVDNLIIGGAIVIFSFVNIKINEKGLVVNNILHKWEDFNYLKGRKGRTKVFYKKLFFKYTFDISHISEEIIRKNIKI